jgi:DNA mismatch repair ATPase MutL
MPSQEGAALVEEVEGLLQRAADAAQEEKEKEEKEKEEKEKEERERKKEEEKEKEKEKEKERQKEREKEAAREREREREREKRRAEAAGPHYVSPKRAPYHREKSPVSPRNEPCVTRHALLVRERAEKRRVRAAGWGKVPDLEEESPTYSGKEPNT